MKIRSYKTLFIIILCIGLFACGGINGDEHKWLIGEWQLTYNPSHDDEDVLSFSSGGRLTIKTVGGRSIDGHYQIVDNQLIMLIPNGSRPIETSFKISEARDQLLFANGAYYTKGESVTKKADK